jgi:hypothetical protein
MTERDNNVETDVSTEMTLGHHIWGTHAEHREDPNRQIAQKTMTEENLGRPDGIED